ncbi:CDP-alcohol phosphatidyltransferase family protein [Candidatus Saccharibacteria bacterium]|nr:CDP-alcohol phosphatidyltransferase family protein [Candidatus Saccharibacteria bacterium]
MPTSVEMSAVQRLMYFPSLHGDESKLIKPFKLIFEVITKLTVNWWAMILIWLAQKARQNWLVTVIKQIPNGMSFFRMLAIPVVMYNLVYQIHLNQHSQAIPWLVYMVLIIALDALDGPCARDLDAVSEFGKRLDPASDKFCFTFIVLGYTLASLFEYSIAFCLLLFGFALWCLWVELKLIRLAVGPFRRLLDGLKQFDPDFEDPGAFTVGKIKFNLQMLACVAGWLGLVYFPSDPTAILAMALILNASRSFGDKSLGKHREEYVWLLVVYMACNGGLARLRIDSVQSQLSNTDSSDSDTALPPNVTRFRQTG